ncbi:MAG: sigma 54-interacting transcriptional regulator [Myxococcota bacterium]
MILDPLNAPTEPDGAGRSRANPVLGPVLVRCFDRGLPRIQRRAIGVDGLVLGRDAVVFDEPLRDARLAGRHARLERLGSEVAIRDLGSPVGTVVNGERVADVQVLNVGDVIRLGEALFVYTLSAPADRPPDPSMIGGSAAVAAIRRSIDAVAPRRHAVVITGETGTGKEVVAKSIHDRSGRTGPFIAVNCSTFADALLASELFGHVRGAFTGAVSENAGLFRAARGGTLLLDEAADLPLPVQAALLRVLETQTVRPVGATRDVEIDVRVIATTNREITELVRCNRFRADLYARLAQWTIRTPTLASRRDDIPELIANLLPRVDGGGRRLSAELCEALLLHEWPLNVRGLLNVLSIAVVSADDDRGPLGLTPDVVEVLARTRSLRPDEPPPAQAQAPTVGPAPEVGWSPPRTLDRDELEALMVRFQGHVAAAARHVGMNRPKLYRMLDAYGLEPNGFRTSRGPGGR